MQWQEWQGALESAQTHINKYLSARLAALPEQAPRLKQAMQYSLLNGGKRVRPFLTLACGEMLGAEHQDLIVAGAAVEVIHTFSLIHDDLPAMDNDDLRRGKPTCHIAFDEATAILTGDALQSLAVEMLCEDPMSAFGDGQRLALIRQLANATGYTGMCGGQAMDLAATGQSIDQQQLAALHQGKTGALIRASILMAHTLAANASNADADALEDYANAVGLAFQVQDDILDITGDTQTLGKPQGSDAALQKSTYPALLGLEGAQQLAQALYQQALQALRALPYNTEVLQSFAHYIVNRTH